MIIGIVNNKTSSPKIASDKGFYRALFVLLTLTFVVSGWFFYHSRMDHLRLVVENELVAVSRSKVDGILAWRAERLGNGSATAGDPFFIEAIDHVLAGASTGDVTKILTRFKSLRQSYHYEDVALVDAGGRKRLSLTGPLAPLAEEERKSLKIALEKGFPVLSDVYHHADDEVLHTTVVVPLSMWKNGSKKLLGFLLLTIDAKEFLYPLLQSWPTSSTTGETLIVERQGNDALYLNELKHKTGTALKLRIPLTSIDVPAVRAVLGTEGLYEGSDYRGVQVLSFLSRIPDSAWFMVTKVDTAEALAPLNFQSRMLLILLSAVAAAILLLGMFLWQRAQKYKTAYQAEAEKQRSADALLRVNRALRMISACNQKLVKAQTEVDLLHEVCTTIVEVGGYRLAWVGYAEQDEAKTVRPVAQAGFDAGYLQALGITWADTERGRGPAGTAIRTGEPVLAQDILNEPDFELWRDEALARGYSSCVAIPLRIGGRTSGVLMTYAVEPQAFDSDEMSLLVELAEDLSYGISTLRARDEQKRTEEDLARHREHLEELVKERTVELSDSEARFRALFNSGADAVFVHGLTEAGEPLPFVEVNDVACRRLGYSREELLRMAPPDIDAAYAMTDRDHAIEQIKSEGRAIFEMVHVARDGRRIPVEISSTRFMLGGAPLVLSIARDITDRKIGEAALNAAMEAADAANRAKSDFLSNMSHELRTPLNAILGFSEIMSEGLTGTVTEGQKEYLDDIHESGRHLLSLINDILDLAKIEAGKMGLDLSEVGVGNLINSSLLMFREKAMKQNIKLEAVIDERVGQIAADERKIKQVLFNLLSNAFKFTPGGGSVLVTARPDGNDVEISVEDTGIGISAEDQKRLFLPFQQIDSGFQKNAQGTGLGLKLCKDFVEMHGGRIRIESETGKGSRFVFSIPARRER